MPNSYLTIYSYGNSGNPVLAWQQPRTSNRNGDGKNIGGENGNDIFAASDRANAQAIATQLLFNDLLGSTIAVIDGNNVNNTDITLFGENAARFIASAQAQSGNENANSNNSNRAANGDNFANNNSEFNNNSHASIGDSFNNAAINNSVFFTGKPHIAELGYSFLFRNYRSNYSKWQTADPLGYPDGWNNLAYVNNNTNVFDKYGLCFEYVHTYSNFSDSNDPEVKKNVIAEGFITIPGIEIIYCGSTVDISKSIAGFSTTFSIQDTNHSNLSYTQSLDTIVNWFCDIPFCGHDVSEHKECGWGFGALSVKVSISLTICVADCGVWGVMGVASGSTPTFIPSCTFERISACTYFTE